MHKRDTFEPRTGESYFWLDVPHIGRCCFARRMVSLTRSWFLELDSMQTRAQAMMRAAAESGDDSQADAAVALVDAAFGLFIARHWVDEEWALDAIATFKVGGFHPKEPWPEHAPALEEALARYGWSTACEFSMEGLTGAEVHALSLEVARALSGNLPSPEDVEDATDFSRAPRASGTSP